MNFALLALLASCVADSGDHLEPLDAPLGGYDVPAYEATVQRTLLMHDLRYAQMLVMPSFGEPFAIYIIRSSEASKPIVVWIRADRSIWSSLSEIMQKTLNAPVSLRSETIEDASRYLRVRTDVVRAEIEEETADALISLWEAALLQTRYPTTMSSPEDGTTFVFASWVQDLGYRAGRTWGMNGHRVDDLINIGNLLASYAAAPVAERAERSGKLRREAEAQLPQWCSP